MLDLMAEGYELWGAAEVAETAETAQPRAPALADELRNGCGELVQARNPQPIRSTSAAIKKRLYGLPAESAESADPPSFEECVQWIKDACPLLPEDHAYVCRRLALMDSDRVPTAALWYINAWAKGSEAEPVGHKKDNAGRRAANAVLSSRQIAPMANIEPRPRRHQELRPKLLQEGQRMAWTIVLNGTRLTMTGRAMTYRQALEVAQARWPGATVEE